MTATAIADLAGLRQHLQWAIELEHATLPPYLYALYSLDPGGNAEAREVLEGIVAEEMLHLALVANILNAVGGRPRLDDPALMPGHPRRLPHGDPSLELALLPFGADALDAFLRIEQPAPTHAVDEAEGYHTIRQFYDAIEDGLRAACRDLGERAVFGGDPARQLGAAHFRHGGGRLIPVDGLDSALAALEEIVEQGEGSQQGIWDADTDPLDPTVRELAHYYRLRELRLGRRYRPGDTPESGPTGEALPVDLDAVRPVRPNPRIADHPDGHPVRVAQEAFNVAYCSLLAKLERAFDGNPPAMGEAVRSMFAVRSAALALMELPDGDGRAGPTFEWVPPASRGESTARSSTITSGSRPIPTSDGGR